MQTDYLQLWRELVDSSSRSLSGELMKRYKNHALQKTDRPDPLLDFVVSSLDPSCSVLDIGAGSGRWTIPLARKARSVTAVEPADDMIELLRDNIRSAGLENVRIVKSTWEEAGVAVHDVAVCAHAMYSSADLATFVRKMEKYSRRTCYLSIRLPPVDGIIGELSSAIYGRCHDSVNAVIAFNALYSMGIYCNVMVEDNIFPWANNSREEAFLRAKRHLLLGSDDRYDGIIRDVLGRRLKLSGDRYIWPDGMRSVLLWWVPGGTC
ncbi:MAG: methyltransferase domain-containing protein [Dehalococcoidales bacterium]|nr:methyltransferase domain-containing protein [Dehalococcoidales bacterium]